MSTKNKEAIKIMAKYGGITFLVVFAWSMLLAWLWGVFERGIELGIIALVGTLLGVWLGVSVGFKSADDL